MREARYVKSHYTPGLVCPACGINNDGMTVASADRDATPIDGSIGVCAYCRETLIYEGGRLRLATQQELAELPATERAIVEAMRGFRR